MERNSVNWFMFHSFFCWIIWKVAVLRKSNQDLNESLKAKIIEIHKLQGKEPPNF